MMIRTIFRAVGTYLIVLLVGAACFGILYLLAYGIVAR
jgi:hypothetical protein